ncbi:hypothetical protein OJAV_G00040130 [Oryzias javanicus]|uniref:Uncharacterized protein n=1 Tax=Oryzias javanicus TaxID=123683 RepID=A0A437DC03_ORYJA|nr:hypothetical protein OJAV_G00040130 [Oryzias javanicus]
MMFYFRLHRWQVFLRITGVFILITSMTVSPSRRPVSVVQSRRDWRFCGAAVWQQAAARLERRDQHRITMFRFMASLDNNTSALDQEATQPHVGQFQGILRRMMFAVVSHQEDQETFCTR